VSLPGSKVALAAVGAVAVGGCALVLAAAADVWPFDDAAHEALAALPEAAPCAQAEPPRAAEAELRAPPEPLAIGFNDGGYLARQVTPAQSASMQRAAGSAIWRSVAQWQVMEPEPGVYDFTTTDPFYCAALAAGIAPLLHITTSPTWAADPALACPPNRCTSPPLAEHLGALRSFASALTARYPHAIAIEAWNEPNLSLFWSGPDPQRYVEVLRAIEAGVEAIDPEMPVLMGGVSDLSADAPATGDIALSRFLDEALRAGAGELVDGFNVHLYPQPPPSGAPVAPPPGLAEARAALAAHGFGSAPIWVTELGVAARAGISRREQARALLGLYAELDRAPDVQAVLFHTLVEPSREIIGGAGFGWVSQGDAAGAYHPFPVYCAFARLLAEPLDCDRPAPA
jgi:polysaccharide biosynthesis protein PslG